MDIQQEILLIKQNTDKYVQYVNTSNKNHNHLISRIAKGLANLEKELELNTNKELVNNIKLEINAVKKILTSKELHAKLVNNKLKSMSAT